MGYLDIYGNLDISVDIVTRLQAGQRQNCRLTPGKNQEIFFFF